jgi:hypothetical protein
VITFPIVEEAVAEGVVAGLIDLSIVLFTVAVAVAVSQCLGWHLHLKLLSHTWYVI